MLVVGACEPFPVPFIILRAHLPKVVLCYEAIDTSTPPEEFDASYKAPGKKVSGVYKLGQRTRHTFPDSPLNK